MAQKPTQAALSVGWVLLAMLLAAAVLVPRAYFASKSLSETMDDDYHLSRGICFWTRSLGTTTLNDPPFGEGIIAVPLLHSTQTTGLKVGYISALHGPGNLWSCEKCLTVIALWKCVLFLPFIGLVFYWLREIYDPLAAWLAVAILCFEPNFAAHIPTGSLDVLAVEAIVLALFVFWRFFQKPTLRRALAVGLIMPLAMMIKHTAIILPGIFILYALLWWITLPWWQGVLRANWSTQLRARFVACALIAALLLPTIFALTLFDLSPPRVYERHSNTNVTGGLLEKNWPAGTYIRSVLVARDHAKNGHPALLLGEYRMTGWWYYYPVVALYKVPIPIFALLLLGILSLAFVRPRFDELALLIPMLAWTAFLMSQTINIGFRHFLVPYALTFFLASRVMLMKSRALRALGGLLALATLLDGLRYHPDYLAYLNFPRHKVGYQISDSNIDWGQSTLELREWVLHYRHDHPEDGRTIWVRSFYGRMKRMNDLPHYLADLPNTQPLYTGDAPPTHGILIISPVSEAGVYEVLGSVDANGKVTPKPGANAYATLHDREPIDIIGHNLLVYDLDELSHDQGFDWRATP